MSLSDKKNIGAPAYGSEQLIHVEYDFAVDGGATSDLDIVENTGTDDLVISLDRVEVETSVTSGGAVTIDMGKGDGGTDFWSDQLKGTLLIDTVVQADTAETRVILANGEKIVLGIEVAAITAGKIHMVFKVQRKQY